MTDLTSNARSPKGTLTWQQKAMITCLLCLEIPFGVVLFPLAAILVLTGILAPVGIMTFRAATDAAFLGD